MTLNRIHIAKAGNQEAGSLSQDFVSVLDRFICTYSQDGYFVNVDTVQGVQGWVLYVSVIQAQIIEALERIVPILLQEGVPFRFPLNKKVAIGILNGAAGVQEIGKVITIYPSDESVDDLAQRLYDVLHGTKGPEILSARRLGNNLFTRYGAFNGVWGISQEGLQTICIYDEHGQLIPDISVIPFQMPTNCPFPFGNWVLANCHSQQKDIFIMGRYEKGDLLKYDPKGSVWLAINSQDADRKPCVIKEGRYAMLTDEFGQDMTDRIKWQVKLHKDLEDLAILPRLIDYFEQDQNVFMVMEFIEGSKIRDYIAHLNRNFLSWRLLPILVKKQILDVILELVDTVAKIHNRGLVLRDITVENFIVRDGKVYAIDLEGAYSVGKAMPVRPFQIMTAGFSSPQMIEFGIPCYEDDIYSLGATILNLITTLSPAIVNTADPAHLRSLLNNIVDDVDLIQIIIQSFAYNPGERPSLEAIQKVLAEYVKSLSTPTPLNEVRKLVHLNEEDLQKCIQASINGICSAPTTIMNDLWLTHELDTNGQKFRSLAPSFRLFDGLPGILSVLAKAAGQGYDVSSCDSMISASWRAISDWYSVNLTIASPSMLFGIAGTLLAAKQAQESWQLDSRHIMIFQRLRKQLLKSNYADITWAAGISGIGAALIELDVHHNDPYIKAKVDLLVQQLLNQQMKPGMWIENKIYDRIAYDSAMHYGNTGIISFLIDYMGAYKSRNLVNTCKQSLSLLQLELMTRKSEILNHGFVACFEQKGLMEGYIDGIMLLLKASRQLGQSTFRNSTLNLIEIFPDEFVHNNWIGAGGILQLGRLYLEAYKEFENENFLIRDSSILAVLFSMARWNGNNSCHWLLDVETTPTTGLYTGMAGIIDFLLTVKKKVSNN